MNHYPHHIGDFVKDTMGFSQGAIGAYRLLMDAYYANEEAPAAEDVYVIGRATTPAERRNVERALQKFELRDGRYYHKRVEEELVAYHARADSARENGKKGGRKPTTEPKRNPQITESETERQTHKGTQSEPSGKLASSHKPVNPPSGKRFPGGDTTPDPAPSPAAAPAEPRAKAPPVPLAEARIDNSTPAAMLAAVCTANGVTPATPFHPLIVEWAKAGITMDRLKAAIATARIRKPAPTKIPPAYLDTILMDNSKPVDSRWKSDDGEAERLCRELGIPGAKINEQRFEWHSRIARALQNQAQRQVA